MRKMMLFLRKRFPDFKDDIKRIGLLFIFVVITIIFIDRLGAYSLGQIFGYSYNHPSSSQLLIPINKLPSEPSKGSAFDPNIH